MLSPYVTIKKIEVVDGYGSMFITQSFWPGDHESSRIVLESSDGSAHVLSAQSLVELGWPLGVLKFWDKNSPKTTVI